MAITDAEFVAAIEEHRLRLRFADDGWHADGHKAREDGSGGRLHRGGRPTVKEAVEAALETILRTQQLNQEAHAARLFAVLARGEIVQRHRDIEIPSEEDPSEMVTVRRWDIRQVSTGINIVTGERSLAAAIIEAERVIAQGGGS